MGLFLCILFVQCVIVAAVVFILKRLLDRELIEGALEKLQATVIAPAQGEIIIKSAAVLNQEIQSRVQSLVRRRAPDIKVVFTRDSGLKGGIVIESSGGVIDFSLASRLKNFWS